MDSQQIDKLQALIDARLAQLPPVDYLTRLRLLDAVVDAAAGGDCSHEELIRYIQEWRPCVRDD
jgi:hypothetical protein